MLATEKKKRKKPEKTHHGFVRTTKLQLSASKEVKDRYKVLCDTAKRATNHFMQQWLLFHVHNNTVGEIREHLAKCKRWHEEFPVPQKPNLPKSKREWTPEHHKQFNEWKAADKEAKLRKGDRKQDKPKYTGTYAFTPELSKHLYDSVCKNFPNLSAAVVASLCKNITGKISSGKATKGSNSLAWAILLNDQKLPDYTEPLPLPFASQFGGLIAPTFDKKWRVWVKQERAGFGELIKDVFEIVGNRNPKKFGSQLAILSRIASGEYQFKGSSIGWSKGQMEVFLCYQTKIMAESAGEGKAVLHASVHCPWRLRFLSGKTSDTPLSELSPVYPGRFITFGGEGRHVHAVRRRLMLQRASRKENTRYAKVGHGHRRKNAGLTKLTQRWRDFVRTSNQQTAVEVMRMCKKNGIGTLYYLQPEGRLRDIKLLGSAGKIQGERDSTSWDWHGMGTILTHKGEEYGVKVVVRKVGARGSVDWD